MPIEEIRLDRIKIGAQLAVSELFLNELTVESNFSAFIENAIVIAFRSFLLGENLGDILIQYPEDWWQAFKERWFTRWLLRKYPVKYKTFRANQKVIYPELKIPSYLNERQIYALILK